MRHSGDRVFNKKRRSGSKNRSHQSKEGPAHPKGFQHGAAGNIARPPNAPTQSREIKRLLQSRHRPEARYDVDNLSALLATVGDIALAMTGVLLAIGLVTLTVGGTGIMNIMLANIAERKQEIGLRKALGARSSEIRLQFLLEAVFISSAGSLAGVFFAVALVASATIFVKDFVNLNISWMSVIFALFISSGVGILFGYQPASRAASLHPVEALRAEA